MDILIKYLVYGIILLFPLGEIARFYIGDSIAFRLQDIVIGILAIVSLLKIKSFKKNSLLKPTLMFFALGILSLLLYSGNLTTQQVITSIFYPIRWLAYSSIFFIISDFTKDIKEKILRLLIIVGAIFDLIGIFQYFLYQNLRNLFYLGWDDHLYRLFSSFLDPNFTGSFYVLYFLLLLGIVLIQVGKNKKPSVIIIILLMLTIASMLLTYSRSALIMFLAGTSSFFIVTKKKKWMLVTFSGIIVFIIAISPFFYIENINVFRTVSSQARLDSIHNAVTIIKDHPILGVGFNSYRYVQIKYGFRKGSGATVSHADAGTDNSFLFALATTGVIGLVSFLYIWLEVTKKAVVFSKKQKIIPLVVVSSLVGLFVDSLFVNSLFFPPIMLWMWILIGIMDYT